VSSQRAKRRLAAVLAADVAGYTRRGYRSQQFKDMTAKP